MSKVNTKACNYSDKEKTLLMAVGWGWEDIEYSLEKLHERSNLEINEIETLLETLINKGIVRKKDGYIFDYTIYKLNDTKLTSIDSIRSNAMQDRICP